MERVVACVAAIASATGVVRADPSQPPVVDPPYEPPPFTRFPDEPDDLPPLPRKRDWLDAQRVLEALKPLRRTTLRLTLGVEAPLGGTVAVDLVLPLRVRIGGSYGRLPATVVHASIRELIERDILGPEIGGLISDSIERASSWRAHLTVKPLARHGLLVGAGLGRMLLAGTTTSDRLAEATDMMAPDGAPSLAVKVDSRITVLEAGVGWEWRWRSHWIAELTLGVLYATRASSRITAEHSGDSDVDDVVDAIGTQAERAVSSALESNVRTPILALRLGYEM